MATIAVNPLFLKDTLFSVAADNYEAALSACTFTPAASTSTWQGLTPTASFTFSTTATWTVTLTYAQDWSSATSLSRYLFDNEGKEVVVKFAPVKGATTAPTFTATVIVTPGAVGGSVNATAEATVTLALKGKPVLATV
jgi:hypothetical protein